MAKTPRPFEKTNMKLRIYALVALAVLISTAAASLFFLQPLHRRPADQGFAEQPAAAGTGRQQPGQLF